MIAANAGNDPIVSLAGVHKAFGEVVTAANVNLAIGRGQFFTLLGPSGSGKSTILRMIAGLEYPDKGVIKIGGQDVTRIPPWRRSLGMVFQQYANFPHLNVAQNVAYGLRRSRLSRQERERRVTELLELVGLPGFQSRPVTVLSGGEQQRVAIARALAPRPTILLLDEPLSALDEKIRREMQSQLKQIQRATATTFIYVTHDQEEALTMSDHISVLNEGHVVQSDTPTQLFRCPATRFVATFFRGCNVLEGELRTQNDDRVLEVAGQRIPIDRTGSAKQLEDGRNLAPAVAVRGENVVIGEEALHCPVRWNATLEEATYRGLYTDYVCRLPDGQHLVATLLTLREWPQDVPLDVGFQPENAVRLFAD